MKCPRCDGTGKLFPGIPPSMPWNCIRCQGLGHVPTEMMEWMAKGEKLRVRAYSELKMYPQEVEKATKLDSRAVYEVMDGLIAYPTSPDPLRMVEQWIREQTEKGLWPPKDWSQRV